MSARRGVAALVLVLAVTSCSHSTAKPGAAGPRATAAKPDVLVAIGADATLGTRLGGLRDSWPQLLYRDAFPLSTVFVNASDQSATVRSAPVQVQLAIEQHATAVVIWLDAANTPCTATTTASRYVADLDALVEPLRASGARVLIGNISPTELCGTAFDDALDQVARARGATVVDLATALAATPNIDPRSSLRPNVSRIVADAFGAALATR